MDTGRAFISESRRYLVEEYQPKIVRSLEGLDIDDLWWRPNRSSNSIGNLVLHLSGNVRQWVVAGIGGAPDLRQRQAEFERDGGMGGGELVRHLEEALGDASEVLSGLDGGRLDEELVIQGLRVTVFKALYHVVEHFAMHTGQIIYLSKLRSGRDLAFYEVDEDGRVETRW